MPTQQKLEQVAELRALIDAAEIAISTGYQGTTMRQQQDLRAALRAAGSEMRVVKNTLLRIAADQAGKPQFGELAEGPTALVVGREDSISAARALTQYLREHPDARITIRRAVVHGEMVDEAYVRDLATVPPREELLARLAGGVVGKVGELAGMLNGVQREFVGLVEARAKQLEEAGA